MDMEKLADLLVECDHSLQYLIKEIKSADPEKVDSDWLEGVNYKISALQRTQANLYKFALKNGGHQWILPFLAKHQQKLVQYNDT